MDIERTQRLIRAAMKAVIPGMRDIHRDIEQDILAKLVERPVPGFGFLVARNMVVNYLRSNFGQGKLKPKIIRLTDGELPAVTIKDDAIVYEMSKRIPDAIDRAVFLLYYHWGFRKNEISSLFGWTPSAVTYRLRAIHQRLSKLA